MVTGLLSMEEIFETFFAISGHGGHLDQVTQLPQTNFDFGVPWRLPIKFRFNGPSGFRGVLQYWTNTWATDAWLYKLNYRLKLR